MNVSLDLGWAVERQSGAGYSYLGLVAVCPSSCLLREPGAKIYWLLGPCCVCGLVFTGLGKAAGWW